MDSCDSHNRRRKHDEEFAGNASRTVLSWKVSILSSFFLIGCRENG
jgi:hypothetical protein